MMSSSESNQQTNPLQQEAESFSNRHEHENDETEATALQQIWSQKSLFLKSILDALSFEVPTPPAGTEIPPVPPTASDQILPSSSESKSHIHEQLLEEGAEDEEALQTLSYPSGSADSASSSDSPKPNTRYLGRKKFTAHEFEGLKKPMSMKVPMKDISSYSSTTDQTSALDPSSNTLFSGSVEEEEDDDSVTRKDEVADSQKKTNKSIPCCPLWTRLTEDGLHKWIRKTVVNAGTHAARYPKTYVLLISLLSILLAGIGLLTNFTIKFDHQELFTPMNSLPARNGYWVEQESGFDHIVQMLLIIHADGDNVLHPQAVRRTFEALDTLRGVEGYDEVCEPSNYIHPITMKHTCWVWSVTEFWDHNIILFDENSHTDLDLVHVLSQPAFPNGVPVFHEMMMGAYQRTNQSLFSDGEDIMYDDKVYEPDATPTATDYISYIPSFMVGVGFPDLGEDTEVFQERALAVLKDLQMEWQQQDEKENPSNLKLEFFCQYAYELEYERALAGDMRLIPIIFLVMLGFTMTVFHKYGTHQNDNYEDSSCEDPDQRRKQVFQSRASLGVASVVTIGCSIMSGFGILFIFGVPFTNITLMAPFIILGVGLDDTFIITGAYFRHLRKYHAECDAKAAAATAQGGDTIAFKYGQQLDIIPQDAPIEPSSPPETLSDEEEHERIVQRVHDTLTEVGLSITLTSTTTTFAFVLGCISTIPGIRWLCIYASTAIVFDFIYQITFFVALLSLDERRVSKALRDSHNNNRDGSKGDRWQSWWQLCRCRCRCCFGSSNQTEPSHQTEGRKHQQHQHAEEEEFFMDRIMRWYAKQLLRPTVRFIVVVVFLVFFGLNVWSTTQLTQEFNVEDYVPDDSYTQPFFRALREYSTLVVPMAVYFRDVNQSDPVIQQQMMDFIDDVSALPQIGQPPEFCWIRDMHAVLTTLGNNTIDQLATSQGISEKQQEQMALMASVLDNGDFTFNEKVEIALSIPTIRDIYGGDIVQDPETLEITASRCYLFIRHLDLADINSQIDMLYDQREITMEQPINKGKADLPFFTFDNFYYYWELYTVAVDELIFTTIIGVVTVCVVGFIMIPHWTAVAFVGPMIVMLYFNLLGTMQVCGMHINAVTYVTIVISIGLLVDFLMHILLRYYETTGTTREAKVKETLETMGASMMLGGFTTWLGVIPMAFSSTKIFMTLFVAFLAMVSWGLLVGLVFLPVVLSYCGPLICTSTDGKAKNDGISKNFDVSSANCYSDTSSNGDGSQETPPTCDTAPTTRSITEGKDGVLSTTTLVGSICTGEFSKDDQIYTVSKAPTSWPGIQ